MRDEIERVMTGIRWWPRRVGQIALIKDADRRIAAVLLRATGMGK